MSASSAAVKDIFDWLKHKNYEMLEDEKALKSRNQSKLFFLTNVHSQSKPLSVML